MIDDTPNRMSDDLFAQDESSAHRFVAGRTGTGKTDRLTAAMAALHAESAPEWFGLKGDDVGVADGGGDQWA
ncbi:hypothetical protein [Halococcus sp. PRR34]|uniref:hypothetical protein n=1 Tax=Halococcus sp. PRR34 TaxID=3020830 RepID=UPI0023620489|nr:hypothetical protein [Halococcus sp. PRR34]